MLCILVAATYAQEYEQEKRRKEWGKKSLREEVGNFNTKKITPGDPVTSRDGGSAKAEKLKKVKQDLLTDCINNVAVWSNARLVEHVVSALNIRVQEADSAEKTFREINKYSVCPHFVDTVFPAIVRFDYVLVCAENEVYHSIDLVLAAPSVTLKSCVITLKPPVSRGAAPITTRPDVKTPVQTAHTNVFPPDTRVRFEYYIGHYLNAFRKALLASVTLTWQDDQLIGVRMKQHKDLSDGDGIGFSNTKNGIYTAADNGPIFVNLERDLLDKSQHPTRKSYYQQITIDKNYRDGLRWATYSTIVQVILDRDRGRETVPITGLVILQPVEELPDLDQLASALVAISPDADKPTLSHADQQLVSALTERDQQLLSTIFSIRYRLQGQVLSYTDSTSQARADTWARLQNYKGRYLCYYLRLSKMQFETSRIEIFPDGTATLRQNGITEKSRGFVRLESDRLWLYFGQNDHTGHEPVRFLVDTFNQSAADNRHLLGIYNGETPEKQLVSGRVIMKRLAAGISWPDFLNLPIAGTYYENFNIDADFTSDTVLQFFCGEQELALTDGPVWANVAKRLLNHSALKYINLLCGLTPNHPELIVDDKFFPHGNFYYYTYKKAGEETGPYLIERNLVTFRRNGTVHIQALNTTYLGHAYYLSNTLRLSLVNADNGGFLEVFLNLNAARTDLSTIDILYGISLWYSGFHIQGKTVVLSRVEKNLLSHRPESFQFVSPALNLTLFNSEDQRIRDEDQRGAGVMAYIRGQHGRYLRTTIHSSDTQFRPRDKSSREVFFHTACFYGYRLRFGPSIISDEVHLLDKCKSCLDAAYAHGYALNFAGIVLPHPKQAAEEAAYVEALYTERFPGTDFRDSRTTVIISRIREIAAEQIFLKEAFSDYGPLHRADLRAYAHLYWPDLLANYPLEEPTAIIAPEA